MVSEPVDHASKRRELHLVTHDPLKLVAKRIRLMREERGHTQEDFAELAQLDRSYYGKIERGGQNVSLLNLGKIAGAFGVKISDLTDDPSVADLKALLAQPKSGRTIFGRPKKATDG